MGVIIGIVKTIILLGFLIFIHESGHFLIAKLCKVNVKEFSIGFGPEIYSKQGRETQYTIRAIPLGGYVNMIGEIEHSDEEGSFNNAKISSRIAIVLAGAVVNIVFGILVYFALMAFSGTNSTTQIDKILENYADQQTILQEGDIVLKINGKTMRVKQDVDNCLALSDGKILDVLVERNSEIIDLNVMPIKIDYGNVERYILGVEVKRAEYNLKNNVYYGFWETVGFLKSMKSSFIMLFSGKIGVQQMTGPIGISEMVVETNGIYDFVYLLAVVSLSLGITNLLPIPALDGGKIALLIIEGIRKKKINEELELKIQSIGISFLLMLSLYISLCDIVRLF